MALNVAVEWSSRGGRTETSWLQEISHDLDQLSVLLSHRSRISQSILDNNKRIEECSCEVVFNIGH